MLYIINKKHEENERNNDKNKGITHIIIKKYNKGLSI